MFFLLRRTFVLGFYGLLAAVGIYVYQQREIFRPLVDLFTLWKNSESKSPPFIDELSGEVVRVLDGSTFQLKDAQGLNYVISLTGLDVLAMRKRDNAAERAIADGSKTNLMKLILGRQVKIELTSTNQNLTGLGVVFLGQTNVNAKVLEAGMSHINPQFIKSLPLKQQYELLAAQRKAQEQKLGIWKE